MATVNDTEVKLKTIERHAETYGITRDALRQKSSQAIVRA